MKKYVILLIAWALTCPVTFASGGAKGDNVIVKIEKGDMPGKVVLRLANLEKQNTQIAVQSVDGAIWFSKNIKRKAGFATKLDLRSIPDGDYVLFVKNQCSVWTQVFSMAADDITFFEKPAEKTEHGQLITHFNDMGDMSLGVQLANLQNRPVTIQINAMGYEQLFSNTIRGETGFAKSFNLDGASNGNYFIYVKTIDATVVQFFTVAGDDLKLGNIQKLVQPKEIVIPEQEVKVQ